MFFIGYNIVQYVYIHYMHTTFQYGIYRMNLLYNMR
jgi:hypothetical protein